MGDPARAVAVGPNPILVDYGNNKRVCKLIFASRTSSFNAQCDSLLLSQLYAANPLSQDWGLPACGHVEQLPNDPLQKQQRLTGMLDTLYMGQRWYFYECSSLSLHSTSR